ncbi:MAG: copper oxidase [Burkholderiaceae bacterium]|nr:copper oxidase [Burkholderiaceae bacterium]
MTSRRQFLSSSTAGLIGAALVSREGAAGLPEAPLREHAGTAVPVPPTAGRPYRPVVTLNGWSLPWRMKQGVKEFHLVAEPVVREIAPGMQARLWGYNGQSPGPTIEVVEGDRVRIFVTNKLPEATSIHWHGQRLPNGMDGVSGLTQPAIPAGKTFVYEFVAQRAGTFMYHPHADDMLQMAMGMMGFWVTHPRDPNEHKVERDYVMLLNAYDIDPGSFTPKVNTMLDFNLWTINSRAFPGVDPMIAALGERVRIRIGNLSMTNHPMHLHGHSFEVSGTDGGWVPKSARWPEVSIDIGVGQMRAIEFVADAPGDWTFHCHKAHHTMGPMGHQVPTMLGVDQRAAVEKINRLVPGYMAMGEHGSDDMAAMRMALPENTLPMMTGSGPFGAIGMGGMFTTLKVRAGLASGDYRDPGWYKQPSGTSAYLWEGDAPDATRASAPEVDGAALAVRKPLKHQH